MALCTVFGVRSTFGAVLMAIVLTMVGSASASKEHSPPRVTVIGDSVLTGAVSNREPWLILRRGFEINLKVGVCRRLTGSSCLFGGAEVPTLVDVVGKVGPTVLVEVGYNDYPATFAQSVEEAIATLLDAGVTQILWANLRESQQQYIPMNEALAAAAGRHPEVKMIDWDSYSQDHSSWFQSDGVHLNYDGAVGMARLFHAALAAALLPPLVAVPTRLPVAHIGQPYSAQLVARGGTPPWKWRLTSGPLPRGLRLLGDGRLTGTPHRAADLKLTLRTTDADGRTAEMQTTVTIKTRMAA